MVKRSLCNRHKSLCFQHLSGVRPPQRQKGSHYLRCTLMCLNEKRLKIMIYDKWDMISDVQTVALEIILSFLSCMSNVSTRLVTEAELRLGSKEISSERGSPARRFLMTDDVLSMRTQWAAIWNDLLSIGRHNEVDGLIYCCIRSRWFMNSPAGEPVE